MFNWRIVIEGTGPHHNGHSTLKLSNGVESYATKVIGDADLNMWEFVEKLRNLGHKITFNKFEVIAGQVDYSDTRPIFHHPI